MRGISGAFAIQELVLRDAIAGRDVLARSRTGSGKTLAFAVPIVERLTPSGGSPTALILAPTRELASQVTEEFRAIADIRQLHVAAVYGGVAIGPQAKRARRADIVIATPGRLLDLVARRLLRLDRVRICVLDEADRMLDMGFLPDVKRILEMLRPDRQTMLFSATLDGEVGRLAARFTHDPVKHEVEDDDGVLVAEADHRFVAVEQSRKSQALVRELAADRGLTLIFVRTQRGADRLAKNLKTQGFRAGALHGGMTQGARERSLGHFASGANDVLVATDVAARGSGPGTHHARDQLRSARGREGVRASRGTHGARRSRRDGHHVRHAGEAFGRRQDRQGARAPRRVRGRGPADGRASARRLDATAPERHRERQQPPTPLTEAGSAGPLGSRTMPTRHTPYHQRFIELGAEMGDRIGFDAAVVFTSTAAGTHGHARGRRPLRRLLPGADRHQRPGRAGAARPRARARRAATAGHGRPGPLRVRVQRRRRDDRRPHRLPARPRALLADRHAGACGDRRTARHGAGARPSRLRHELHLGDRVPLRAGAGFARAPPAAHATRISRPMQLPYFRFVSTTVADVPTLLSRTGYSGELGYELYYPRDYALHMWDTLIAAGATPCGLGALRSTRMEKKYPLYGLDVSETTSPLEAGLGWAVDLDAGPFVGRDVLRRQRDEGVERLLTGIELADLSHVPAAGDVVSDATAASWARSRRRISGWFLEKALAMGYLPAELPSGSAVTRDARPTGRRRRARPRIDRSTTRTAPASAASAPPDATG